MPKTHLGQGELRKDQSGSEARKSQEVLDSIMDGLAEDVLSISDEELLAEAAEEGYNPAQEAEAVRRSLLDMVRNTSLNRPRMTVRRSGSRQK